MIPLDWACNIGKIPLLQKVQESCFRAVEFSGVLKLYEVLNLISDQEAASRTRGRRNVEWLGRERATK